jgi:DnaK suppressor protein
MNAEKQAELRQRLEARKTEIENDVSYMAEEIQQMGEFQDNENAGLGNHMAEDGASVQETERLVALTDDFQDLLAQIDDALERMDEGTYGICERCGKPIPEERLEAFPYVRYDVNCQAIVEREQGMRAGG